MEWKIGPMIEMEWSAYSMCFCVLYRYVLTLKREINAGTNTRPPSEPINSDCNMEDSVGPTAINFL